MLGANKSSSTFWNILILLGGTFFISTWNGHEVREDLRQHEEKYDVDQKELHDTMIIRTKTLKDIQIHLNEIEVSLRQPTTQRNP